MKPESLSAKRARSINALTMPNGSSTCHQCGKNSCKRKDKNPAPICFVIDNLFRSICMACAKRIVSRLDAVIEKIEGKYERTVRNG